MKTILITFNVLFFFMFAFVVYYAYEEMELVQSNLNSLQHLLQEKESEINDLDTKLDALQSKLNKAFEETAENLLLLAEAGKNLNNHVDEIDKDYTKQRLALSRNIKDLEIMIDAILEFEKKQGKQIAIQEESITALQHRLDEVDDKLGFNYKNKTFILSGDSIDDRLEKLERKNRYPY